MTAPPGGDATPPDDEFIDRRSGKERRQGGDRRKGGRRHRRSDVTNDRRSGDDRRLVCRRSGVDRRIFNDPRYRKPRPRVEAPPVYTADQMNQVQHICSRIGHRAACPVCDGGFTLGPVERRGHATARQVSCADCGRSAIVTDCVLARVLVFSRVEAVRVLLRDTLGGAGHEVIEPGRGADALDVYRDNPADVVVADSFALGDLDGREFLRGLRREFADPRILVLAPRVSLGQADPWAAARQLGATQVLRMPCSREELLVAVREMRP